MPRIERLHQNTPEWHRWRMQGIGASDAPVIMGETVFKTREPGRYKSEYAGRFRGAGQGERTGDGEGRAVEH